MVHVQPRIRAGEWDTQTSLEFWDTNGSLNLWYDLVIVNKKKRKKKEKKKENQLNCGLCRPVRPPIKIKRVWKEVWISVPCLRVKEAMEHESDGDIINRTILKGLIKGLEDLEIIGPVETIQTTAYRKSARILRRVLEIWGDLLSLKLQWKTIG